MARGKSPAARSCNGAVPVSSGGVPGPAAKNTASGAGGTGAAAGGTSAAASGAVAGTVKAHVSEKNVAKLIWLLMLFLVTMNKGQKYLFFMSSIIAFAAFKYLSDLDEKHPRYKSQVLGAVLVSAVAFWCFDMVPYFESDEAFLKWLVDKMPELEKVYTFAHNLLKLYSHGKPVAGVKKTVLDVGTFHGVLMKLRIPKNTKWFGMF